MGTRIVITVDDDMLEFLDEQVRAGQAGARDNFIESLVEDELGRRRPSETDDPDADID